VKDDLSSEISGNHLATTRCEVEPGTATSRSEARRTTLGKFALACVGTRRCEMSVRHHPVAPRENLAVARLGPPWQDRAMAKIGRLYDLTAANQIPPRNILWLIDSGDRFAVSGLRFRNGKSRGWLPGSGFTRTHWTVCGLVFSASRISGIFRLKVRTVLSARLGAGLGSRLCE